MACREVDNMDRMRNKNNYHHKYMSEDDGNEDDMEMIRDKNNYHRIYFKMRTTTTWTG